MARSPSPYRRVRGLSLPQPDARSVFLNVPFDSEYVEVFIALVVGLTCFGRKPRCVLEIPPQRHRLDRIYELIAGCAVSIHDLSRVELSGSMNVPRFNMPFELGVAYCLSRHHRHAFLVLEHQAHRLEYSLSDLNGYDPLIHGSTADGALGCVLDGFESTGRAPTLAELREICALLSSGVAQAQKDRGLTDPFHPQIFRGMVAAALSLAERRGLIAAGTKASRKTG